MLRTILISLNFIKYKLYEFKLRFTRLGMG